MSKVSQKSLKSRSLDVRAERSRSKSINLHLETPPTWITPAQDSFTNTSYYAFMQRRWAKFTEEHDCNLMEAFKKRDIFVDVIDSGMFIELRRKWQKYLCISPKHPYTSKVFRSAIAIRNEEIKHIINHKWMVHPFSLASLHYRIVISLIYLYSLAYILPLNLIYVRYSSRQKLHTFVVDIFVTASIVLNCFMGYFDTSDMIVYMSPGKVFQRYLRKNLFFDIISCVPSYYFYMFFIIDDPTYINLLKWPMVARIKRIVTVDHSLNMVRLYYGISAANFVSLQIFIKTYVTILVCMIIIFFIKQPPINRNFVSEMEDWLKRRGGKNFKLLKKLGNDTLHAKNGMLDTVSAMFGVGKLPAIMSILDTFGFALCSILALLLHYWIICKIYGLWLRFNVSDEIQDSQCGELDGFLKCNALPQHIRDETRRYFDFTFQKSFFKEATLLEMLSDNLRKEIPNYNLGCKIKNVPFIKPLPNHVTMTIVANMTSIYYCPGDIIFKAKTYSGSLYYIKYGTVALFHDDGAEICHMEDNSYYGDISVVIPHVRTNSMMAISPCQILKIDHHGLFDILSAFPDLEETVRRIGRQLFASRRADWVTNVMLRAHSGTNISRLESIYSEY